jgi:uncharacterized spore protein YtfJ
MTFEMPINVLSRHILYLVFSSFLSSLLLSELFDIMPQIEKKIKNNIDEKGSNEENGKIEIDNKMRDISAYK